MIDNLKCPFCGAELRQYAADFWCKNPDCIIFNDIIHNKVIITDLIAGKKAQDALKRIANYMYARGETDMKSHVNHLRKIARNALTTQIKK